MDNPTTSGTSGRRPWTLGWLAHSAATVAWLAQPITAGAALGAALDPATEAVRVTAAVVMWGGWGMALVALLVPRSWSLTVARIVVPAGLAATAWAASTGEASDVTAGAALALAAIAAAAILAPGVGDRFAQGSAYGSEQRFLLRPPTALAALAPAVWALVVSGAVAGPLLLAAGEVGVGAAILIAGWAVSAVGVRSLHGLSRRWIVFVPAGVVLHDPFGLADPVLFPRSTVRRLGPALSDATGLDITPGTAGLVLSITVNEPADLVPAGRRRGERPQAVPTDQVLFVATRPGAVLQAAAQRRFPVGQAATPPPTTTSPS